MSIYDKLEAANARALDAKARRNSNRSVQEMQQYIIEEQEVPDTSTDWIPKREVTPGMVQQMKWDRSGALMDIINGNEPWRDQPVVVIIENAESGKIRGTRVGMTVREYDILKLISEDRYPDIKGEGINSGNLPYGFSVRFPTEQEYSPDDDILIENVREKVRMVKEYQEENLDAGTAKVTFKDKRLGDIEVSTTDRKALLSSLNIRDTQCANEFNVQTSEQIKRKEQFLEEKHNVREGSQSGTFSLFGIKGAIDRMRGQDRD